MASSSEPPPSKKQKILQNHKYDQVWKEAYSQNKGIVRSDKGPSFAFCELCSTHFSIRASGAYDIKKHCNTSKHTSAAKASSSTSKPLTSFFASKTAGLDTSVIRAEVVFTKFLIDRNLPLAISDDVGDVLRSMFPNSEECKKYSCGRTKTTAIVHELAKQKKEETISGVDRCAVYSLATDGGNDTNSKLFPVVVRYADEQQEKIVTEILSVDTLPTPTATGKNIFDHLDKTIKDCALTWDKCISFSTDNAAVMVGEKSGVAAFIHEENKNTAIIGCPCHRLNLAALKAANAFPTKLDQLLIDIYFFLDKSSKRVARLRELQETLGTETHKILKHVNTRWLSLGPCISRLLEQWEPLSALFLELKEQTSKSTSSKADSILSKLLDDEVKAYALFLQNIVTVYEKANGVLQSEEPLIHKSRDILLSVIQDLSLRFVKPAVLSSCNLLDSQLVKEKNLLDNEEIDVGFKCKKLVSKLDETQRKKFYNTVKDYYLNGVKYLQKHCYLDDETLINAAVANPSKRLEATFSSVKYFVDKFPSLLLLPQVQENDEVEESMDILLRQFRKWQTSDFDQQQEETIDSYWFRLSKTKDQCGQPVFLQVSKCMLGILTLFHSNSTCERIFSLIKRNRTDFRASMSNKLVESISICKIKCGPKSYKEPLTTDLLKKAKSATAASLAAVKE